MRPPPARGAPTAGTRRASARAFDGGRGVAPSVTRTVVVMSPSSARATTAATIPTENAPRPTTRPGVERRRSAPSWSGPGLGRGRERDVAREPRRRSLVVRRGDDETRRSQQILKQFDESSRDFAAAATAAARGGLRVGGRSTGARSRPPSTRALRPSCLSMSHTMLSSSLGFPTLASSIAAPRASSRSRLTPPSLPRASSTSGVHRRRRAATLSQRASFAARSSVSRLPRRRRSRRVSPARRSDGAASRATAREEGGTWRSPPSEHLEEGCSAPRTPAPPRPVGVGWAGSLYSPPVSARFRVPRLLVPVQGHHEGHGRGPPSFIRSQIRDCVQQVLQHVLVPGRRAIGKSSSSPGARARPFPPRADVVGNSATGLTVNFIGLGAAIIGLQATTGVLFAKGSPRPPSRRSSLATTPCSRSIFLIQSERRELRVGAGSAPPSAAGSCNQRLNLPTPQK